MNKRDIEQFAVSAVKDSITSCDYLDSYLSDNDKTPSWDGEIFIYSNPNRTNEDFVGSVKCQIKGKVQTNLSKGVISYPVKVVDLKNFQRIGSTIFFVVYISPNKVDRKIYYNDLKPVRLKHYIQRAKGKTIKIPFRLFPSEDSKKTDICVNLYDDGIKQIGLQDRILSFEELRDKTVTQLNLSYTSYSKTAPDIIQHILDNSASMYVKIDGSDISYPLDTTDAKLQIEHTQSAEIKVLDDIYYTDVHVIRRSEELVIKVGDSLKITHSSNTKQVHFEWRLSKSLRNAARDLAFINAAIQAKEFSINHSTYGIPDSILTEYDIEWSIATLKNMQECVRALDILNVSKDIEWETLNSNEQHNLNTLIKVFVRGEIVHNLKKDIPPVCAMQIQNIRILLGVMSFDEPNSWRIYNALKHPSETNIMYRKNDNDQLLPTSIYSLFKVDDYITFDNIDYESLPTTYISLASDNPMLLEIVNRDMLIMLAAYDKKTCGKLIKAIEKLAQWSVDNCSLQSAEYDYFYINLMQVYKRTRELLENEKDNIYSIYEKTDKQDIKIAATLLLGDYIGAKRCFARMTIEEQEFFKSLPIYHFWQG